MLIKLFIEHDRKDWKKFIGKLEKGGKVVFLPKYFKFDEKLEIEKFYKFDINKGDLIEKEKFCILKHYNNFILSKEDKLRVKHINHIEYDWLLNRITYQHIINHVERYENSKDDLDYILEHLDKYKVGFFMAYNKKDKIINIINEEVYYKLCSFTRDYINYNFFRKRININELKEIIDIYEKNISINALDDLNYIMKNSNLLIKYFSKNYTIKCIKNCLKKIQSIALGNYNTNIEIIENLKETNKKYNLGINKIINDTIENVKYQRDNVKYFNSGDDDGGEYTLKQYRKYGATCPHSNR